MSNKEVIEQLKSLKAHCESMKESGEEWDKDAQALEYAIKELERTAQEVTVQEQLNQISTGSKNINQIRKENRLAPIEGGDIFTIKL